MVAWLRRVLVLALIALVAVALMLATRGLRLTPSLPETVLREVLAPVGGVTARMVRGASEIGETVAAFRQLRAENEQLRADLERLRGVEAQIRQLERENQQLRQLLGLKQARPDAALAARVIARSPEHWFEEVTLDQGSRDGVQVGMVALAPSGLVGRVVAVTPHTSRLLLLTDPESGVGAVIGRTGEAGVVYGRGGNVPELVMTLFSPDADVREGDDVVTSGLGPVFPPGLPVGTVVSVRRDPAGLGLQAIVKPNAELNRLTEVLLLRRQEGGEER
ncbi:MAG: rod shape-determining protein MreC [Symbiobacteriaceae bacterium]|nr:MAG: rod shape-determining protein MreC [Bacillota bacterium]